MSGARSDASLLVRKAQAADLRAILDLLADDPLGKTEQEPEGPVAPSLTKTFDTISQDPNQLLLVVEDDGTPCAYLQMTFIPGLTMKGAWRAHIEAVRVASTHRGQGVGRTLFQEALAHARARGCAVVQLMTDRRRPEALAFYEALGFKNSHNGMKLFLDKSA